MEEKRYLFKYVNMQKNFTFYIIIIILLFHPGLLKLGFLSNPGIFSFIVVVAVSAFIINNLSQVSSGVRRYVFEQGAVNIIACKARKKIFFFWIT